jgi:tRNA-2-methylthio-N6-dimethylallyladenosine synthase
MNVNDSERSAGLFRREGLLPAKKHDEADLIFINTCAVREKAEKKLFSLLGRLRILKQKNPRMRIVVGGCVAQLHGRSLLVKEPLIDAIIGTQRIHQLPELLTKLSEGIEDRIVDVSRSDRDLFSIPSSVIAHSNSTRASVTVMEGCNLVCSFCVVPRTRGPERCRPFDDIISEIEDLVSRGFSEVMLLGQTVNAYRWGVHDFSDLLKNVSTIKGLKRLRFTTNHPIYLTMKLMEVMRDHATVCPHIHLPVQSGSDRILTSMRRGYTSAEYIEKTDLLRKHITGIAISSDVIVGYPGETEKDFHDTMRLLDQVGFDSLFNFCYSSRPGTSAQSLLDDVPAKVKRARLNELNEWQQSRQLARNKECIGMRVSVLVDQVNTKGKLSGRTPHLRIVHFEGPAILIGKIVNVEILEVGANSMIGQLAETVSSH